MGLSKMFGDKVPGTNASMEIDNDVDEDIVYQSRSGGLKEMLGLNDNTQGGGMKQMLGLDEVRERGAGMKQMLGLGEGMGSGFGQMMGTVKNGSGGFQQMMQGVKKTKSSNKVMDMFSTKKGKGFNISKMFSTGGKSLPMMNLAKAPSFDFNKMFGGKSKIKSKTTSFDNKIKSFLPGGGMGGLGIKKKLPGNTDVLGLKKGAMDINKIIGGGTNFNTERTARNRLKQQLGLKPMGDRDKDGVINILDCNPLNRMLQGPGDKGSTIYESGYDTGTQDMDIGYTTDVEESPEMTPAEKALEMYQDTEYGKTKEALRTQRASRKQVELDLYKKEQEGLIDVAKGVKRSEEEAMLEPYKAEKKKQALIAATFDPEAESRGKFQTFLHGVTGKAYETELEKARRLETEQLDRENKRRIAFKEAGSKPGMVKHTRKDKRGNTISYQAPIGGGSGVFGSSGDMFGSGAGVDMMAGVGTSGLGVAQMSDTGMSGMGMVNMLSGSGGTGQGFASMLGAGGSGQGFAAMAGLTPEPQPMMQQQAMPQQVDYGAPVAPAAPMPAQQGAPGAPPRPGLKWSPYSKKWVSHIRGPYDKTPQYQQPGVPVVYQ